MCSSYEISKRAYNWLGEVKICILMRAMSDWTQDLKMYNDVSTHNLH